ATEKFPNGTLPTTALKLASANRVFSNPCAWIWADGYSHDEIRAVVWSNSTPTICADSGACPINSPEPDPGANTGPPSNPARCNADHIAAVCDGSVECAFNVVGLACCQQSSPNSSHT